MYIFLTIALFIICGWVPIICGTDSYALPFIGGLCGIIIALALYISAKLSKIKENQEKILRRSDEQKDDKNKDKKIK